MKLGDTFPNLDLKTTTGDYKLYDFLGDSWGILFSHPGDFTPVCTTELARLLQIHDEFKRRGIKIIALSCDSVETHRRWIEDIKFYAGITDEGFPYPIIADEDREIVCKLEMLDPREKDADGVVLPARAVFVIDKERKMRLSILYPASTGRNFDEILRVMDSLFLTDLQQVATPADWKPSQSVMVLPNVSEEDVKTKFPATTIFSMPSEKKYLRLTPLD